MRRCTGDPTRRWQGSGAADAARPETDRPFRGAGTSRRRRHGAGLSRQVRLRAARGDQDGAGRARGGPALPGALHPRGGGGPRGQRLLHRGRRRRRPPRGRALARHGLRARALPRGDRQRVRPAARAGGALAGRRRRRGAAVHPQRRPGPPRPQAVQRPRGRGRPPGHRLRHRQRRVQHPADDDQRRRRHPRLHVAGTGARLPQRHRRQRHLLPRLHPGLRRDRPRPLPGRQSGRDRLHAAARGTGPGRAAR